MAFSASPLKVASVAADPRPRRTAAFTLMEVLVAVTILSMAIGMTMVVFIAALKRAQHTENMLSGTAELRYATDFITEAIRSAPQTPSTTTGHDLLLQPKNLPYLIVSPGSGTWIDSGNSVRGWKDTQNTLQVDPVVSPVFDSVFLTTDRPAGALSTGDVATYFKPAVDLTSASAPKVSDILKATYTVAVPATGFGNAIPSLTVKNVSQNGPNNKTATVTFTNKLGQNVPDGTRISITSGKSMLFRIIQTKSRPSDPYTETQLQYFPDSSDTTHPIILARNVALTPLKHPETSTGASPTTVPFTIDANAQTVTINLQKIPNGTSAGRTLQGVQTTVYTRNDPTIP